MTTHLPPESARAGARTAVRRAWRRAGMATAALLVLSAAQAAGIYKWKDAQGNTHFTDTPPPADAVQAAPAKPAPAARPGAANLTDAQMRALSERFGAACRAGAESPACLQARREVSRELQKDCAPQQSREFCAQGMDAIARDLAQGIEGQPPPDPLAESARSAERATRVEELKARECAQQRHALAVLQQRAAGASTEILTPQERAEQPAQIRKVEDYLARNCQ